MMGATIAPAHERRPALPFHRLRRHARARGRRRARAKANGVELWALTDHDEIGGQQRARDAALALGLPYLTGTEISVTFAGITVHIVGLGFDRDDAAPRRRPAGHARRPRGARAARWPSELAKVGIAGAYEGALKFVGNPDLISRTHFARFLVESGVCADTQEVFRRFLVEGKPGFVPHRWATLRDAVTWIVEAGGIAVVAHPARYKFTPTEEYALFTEFKALGGRGVEVVTGAHSAADARALRRHRARVRPARLARQRLPQPRGKPHRPRRPAAVAGRELKPVWEAIECANPRRRLNSVAAPTIGACPSTSKSIPRIRSSACSSRRRRSCTAAASRRFPTDSSYALVCHLDDKAAAEQLRRIRGVDDRHHLTLLCRDLSELASYARVDNKQYRLLKAATPGPFTFILEATKEVPRRVSHPSRRTIGLRVPEHAVTSALLDLLGQPLLATTLIAPGESEPMNDPAEIRARFEKPVQAIVDAGACPMRPTTVVDLTGETPVLLRLGRGDPALLGIVADARRLTASHACY